MIVVVEPAVAYGETNMYKNNTYRVREGVVNLTMINPTPIASVYDIVYSIRSAIAPKDDPVSFVTEGLTPAIKYRHGKVATLRRPPDPTEQTNNSNQIQLPAVMNSHSH